ncbi:hypothetical protein PVAND_014430 [Polypedilum vanderplanki]|uniref:BTB domain-containing protein n=1 Tax=Polypedilum vanderplanki TaxID=319348 RepID=A0A9J6B961_POLVA|nr:hypothetical protein PVAND_014430 [Polypedilum vanderplanki]
MFSIECKFAEWAWIDEHRYTCNIKRKNIPENQSAILDGRHLVPHTNFDVTGISFLSCRLTKIPKNLLLKSFSLLQALAVSNCGLREIKREDLIGLHDLRVLWLNDNEIEFLPGDLFIDMKKLEYVSFEKNKIRFIDAELLDPLPNLKLINFYGNVAIDKVYNSTFSTQGNASLEGIKIEIRTKCRPPFRENPKKLEENEELREQLNKRDKEIEILNEKVNNSMANEASLHEEISKMQKETKKFKILDDIMIIARDEDFKDFTILTRGEKFKLHKFIIAARSPTIKRIIKIRPETESVTFTDIPSSAFRELLKYFYDNEFPSNDANFKNILVTAYKLEIDEIKNYSLNKLFESLNEENALEILTLANKFDIEILRTKAFEEIQKVFPERELKIEIATDVGKIKKLIEAKKKFDEEFKNL